MRPVTAVLSLVLAASLLVVPSSVSASSPARAPASSAAPATAPAAAPGRPGGPRLTEPRAALRRAVRCTAAASRDNGRRTVVLVHGTGSTPRETWSWNYVLALGAEGFGVCTVRLPGHGLASYTRSAEYVVHAVRVARRRSGRDVAVVGHSQGGSLGLWVTRFWPDVRRAVSDVVSLAGPLRGTAFASALCAAGRCVPLAWQLSRGSAHMRAQSRGPLPSGPAYTSIGTRYDELVLPQPAVSRLPGVRFHLLQDLCPADPSEHALVLGDPLAFRLALDAITHRGPASAARLPRTRCREAFIPHGDLAASEVFLATPVRLAAGIADVRRMRDSEPPLPAYARQDG